MLTLLPRLKSKDSNRRASTEAGQFTALLAPAHGMMSPSWRTGLRIVSRRPKCAKCRPSPVAADTKLTTARPRDALPSIETRLDHADLIICEAEEPIDEHVDPVLPSRLLALPCLSGKRGLSGREFTTQAREFDSRLLKLSSNVIPIGGSTDRNAAQISGLIRVPAALKTGADALEIVGQQLRVEDCEEIARSGR